MYPGLNLKNSILPEVLLPKLNSRILVFTVQIIFLGFKGFLVRQDMKVMSSCSILMLMMHRSMPQIFSHSRFIFLDFGQAPQVLKQRPIGRLK